ncbi:hypothetical protein B0920_17920 [Massilia sp. KIM]|uniref:GDSL-type esterase/lipase family protein n=1 Tax=Massilia sp. KIM TaxID=1955422 RepID=UPI00098F5810|nr:GDSL-type esterase/lipase family protein [Massilia sp. KIM]OON60831.1 hypothetical protein B0920_17920 [Massilia sp. KIM]
MRFPVSHPLCALLLCLGALPAQAAPSTDCARLYREAQRAGGAGAFSWSTQAAPPAALPAAPLRIALWGDSLTSSRDFIDAALEASGIRAQAAHPSFIQAGAAIPGLRLPLKAACAAGSWQTGHAYKEVRKPAGYSPGLVSMQSDTPGATLFLDFRHPQATARLRQLDILFEKSAPQGSLLLAVSVDGGDEEMVPLSRTPDRVLRIQPAAPFASIRLRLVSGLLRLHGFLPLYQDAPAAILDTHSVPGGTLRAWANADERLFPPARAAGEDYDLILVQYGTNEGAAPSLRRAQYESYLRTHLARLRAFHPTPRCVLIGPPDRGAGYGAIHQQIAQAQKKIAPEFRCAAWDWQAAMGGTGSAARWARMAPPQMQGDLTHLSAKGYQASGRKFANDHPLDTH